MKEKHTLMESIAEIKDRIDRVFREGSGAILQMQLETKDNSSTEQTNKISKIIERSEDNITYSKILKLRNTALHSSSPKLSGQNNVLQFNTKSSISNQK